MLAGAYRESRVLLSASKHHLRVASVIIVAVSANSQGEQTGGLMESIFYEIISHNREEKSMRTVELHCWECKLFVHKCIG